jgi:hypothetical protein
MPSSLHVMLAEYATTVSSLKVNSIFNLSHVHNHLCNRETQLWGELNKDEEAALLYAKGQQQQARQWHQESYS